MLSTTEADARLHANPVVTESTHATESNKSGIAAEKGTAARKFTNLMMSREFTAQEMTMCVLKAGHKNKQQIDQLRLANVVGK